MKVSFDFDDTLDREPVQSFAAWLIAQGVEVWVTTSRYANEYWLTNGLAKPVDWSPNADLWDVVARLKIRADRVTFTGHRAKWTEFRDSDFLWHLDDDPEEIDEINQYTNVRCVNSKGSFWMRECKEILWPS